MLQQLQFSQYEASHYIGQLLLLYQKTLSIHWLHYHELKSAHNKLLVALNNSSHT